MLRLLHIFILVLLCSSLAACSADDITGAISDVRDTVEDAQLTPTASSPTNTTVSSNTENSSSQGDALEVIETVSHIPTRSEELVAQSAYICIDYSNADQGYIMVQYLGSHTGQIKFQITGPDGLTYTFNLSAGQDFQTLPLTGGSGSYTLNTFEQSEGTSYYTVDSTTINASLIDTMTTYLYPNQFVYYTQDSSVVDLSIEAATGVYSEIDMISSIYYTAMDTVDYDYDLAEVIAGGGLVGYIPDLDSVISSGSGICFDYAALMVAMLRIQELPAKLVIGYAGEAYHAWINVYTEENGWIDGAIFFDGTSWSLMDPTFADTATNKSAINEFIGDGTNYTEKYVY